MALYVILGTLAAFGALCAVWTALGLLLPESSGMLHYCPDTPEEVMAFAGRYLWLRSLGLVRCRLTVRQTELDESQKQWLSERGILLCPEHGIGAESN